MSTHGFEHDDDTLFGEESATRDTYLTFSLGSSDYAIPVASVEEIVRLPPVRKVPDVPSYILGVINLRGRVVPLMDARTRLGLNTVPHTDRTIVIVLESEGEATGVVADRVNGVSQFPPEQIEPHTYGKHGNVRAVAAIGRQGENTTLMLDTERLLGEANQLIAEAE
jgi:purine-binding chemotaxis protein CheW